MAHKFVKSGQCFEFLSVITVCHYLTSSNVQLTKERERVTYSVEKIDCTEDVPCDPEVEKLVQGYLEVLQSIKQEVIGETRDAIPCIKKQLRYNPDCSDI